MFKYMNTSKCLCAYTLLMLVVISCVPIVSCFPTPEPTSIETEKTRTVGLTSLPTIFPTATPSIMSFSTWTSQPTLPDEQAEARMLEWLGGTPECTFPCWAGIMPGVTTWRDAKQILGKVVNLESVQENINCDFGPCDFIAWRSRTSLDIHGNILFQSEGPMYASRLEGYPPITILRPAQILTQYGPPEKVFIETICPVPDPDNVYIALILVYPSLHFIIKYNMGGMLVGEYINGYFTPEEGLSILIKQLGEWSAGTIYSEIHNNEPIPAKSFQPLEAVTDMTIDDFYKKFVSFNENDYIVTPCQLWIP